MDRSTSLARAYISRAAKKLGYVAIKRGYAPPEIADQRKAEMDAADAAIEAEIKRMGWGKKNG